MLSTLRAKLISGYGILVVFMLLCGGIGLYGAHKLSGLIHYVTGPTWDAADGEMNAQIALQAQFIALTRMNAGEERFRDDLADAESKVENAFRQMRNSELIPGARMATLESLLQDFNRRKADLLQDIYNGGLVQQLHAATTALLNELSALEALADQRIEEQKQTINATITQLDIELISVPALSIIVALTIIYLVVLRSVKNIEAVTSVAKKIAEGDLRACDLTINSHDEVGDLQRSIENMRQLLANSIGDVKSSADQLASASEEMSSITKEGGSKVQEQSRQTESLGSAVEKMTNSFKAVAQNTMEAKALAESAQSDAHSGQTIVNDTIRAMGLLTENVMNAGLTIEQLS